MVAHKPEMRLVKLNCSLLVRRPGSVYSSVSNLLDLKTIGVAVGIALLSSLGGEIYAFQLCRPPSWIFQFQLISLWLHSVETYLIGMHNSENIGIAGGIPLLSSVGAEMRCGVHWTTSAVYITFLGQPNKG